MRTIAFLLLMAFSVPASAEEKVKVIQLFKTASAFLSQSEAARIEYVEGLADALNLVAITGKPDFAWYAECMDRKDIQGSYQYSCGMDE